MVRKYNNSRRCDVLMTMINNEEALTLLFVDHVPDSNAAYYVTLTETLRAPDDTEDLLIKCNDLRNLDIVK